ncbi:hypothetical protein DFQ26_009808, partial [Actinomortierella ambigua]
ITFRRLHCRNCKRYFHRDKMAAHNMCNVVRSALDGHGRPLYLQPVRSDGTYPWLDRERPKNEINRVSTSNNASTSNNTSTSTSTNTSTSTATTPKRRSRTTPTQPAHKKAKTAGCP